MELRQLRYFLAVAEELNFTRAARRVGIAQPPLSQQILALEKELGTALFLRSKRHVQLTGAGQELIVHARRTLQCADAAKAAAQMSGQGLRGEFSIGAIYTAAYTILPRLLRIFRENYPLVTVRLQEMGISEQHAALRAGALDAGLLRPPADAPGLDFITLFEEPFVAVVPAQHRFRNRRALSLAEIAAEPFVSLPRAYRDSVGGEVAGMFSRARLQPRLVQEVAEMHTLICLVASGLGVSVVPSSISGIRMRDVMYKPIVEETPRTPVCLATARGGASMVTPRFVEIVRAAFPE